MIRALRFFGCGFLIAFVVAWETKEKALQQSLDLVHDSQTFGVASLSTRYPSDHPVSDLADLIITGPEYFAPCFPETGDLLFLGLTVSQTWRNVLNSSARNATVSIGANPDPDVPDKRHLAQHSSHWQQKRPKWRRGMPSKGRATLFGHFELINATTNPATPQKLSKCYLHHHPDASHWAPGSSESPHVPFWAQFVVNRVYWVGGFGDEHYIGWFSQSEWMAAWKAHTSAASSDFRENSVANIQSSDLRTASDYLHLFGSADPEWSDGPLDQLVFQ